MNNFRSEYRDFDSAKEKIFMTVVNSQKNSDSLSVVPHRDVEDLSVIYKVMVDGDEGEIESFTIDNDLMNTWGITSEELDKVAVENTRKILPITVDPIEDLIPVQAFGGDPSEHTVIYVISNSNKVLGAANMLYGDVLSDVSDRLGSNLYILPSSIHEVLAISSDSIPDPKELADMVKTINETTVLPNDQLSNHVYSFDARTKKLSLADTSIEEIRNDSMSKESEPEIVNNNFRRFHR